MACLHPHSKVYPRYFSTDMWGAYRISASLKKKRTLICNNTAMNYLRKLFFMHFLEAYEAPPNQTIWTGKEWWAMLTTPPPTTIMTTQCDNQMPWDKQQRTAPNTNTVPRLLVLAESRSVRTAYWLIIPSYAVTTPRTFANHNRTPIRHL